MEELSRQLQRHHSPERHYQIRWQHVSVATSICKGHDNMDKHIKPSYTCTQDRHEHRDVNRQHESQKQGALQYKHPKLLIV